MKKYNLFKNASYAIEGLTVLLKEKAFIIEIILFFIMNSVLLFLNISFTEKLIMFISLIIVLITEALNTAIEYTVDLATDEWHILAKKAKDVASSAVLLAVLQAVFIWGVILI